MHSTLIVQSPSLTLGSGVTLRTYHELGGLIASCEEQ